MLRHPDEIDANAAGGGFWEELLLGPAQAVATLEMANGLELGNLGCDLGLSSNMSQRVIDNRPFADLDELVAVPYFGASHLLKMKDGTDWWIDGEADDTTPYDCVSYTPEQEEAALVFINEAGWSQLCAAHHCGFGGWSTQASIIINGRTWTSLADLAATSGIGPASMLKVRGQADRLLAGELSLGPDSVQAVLSGAVESEHVELGLVRVLEVVEVGSFGPPNGGYSFLTPCARIADYDDPTPETAGHSALYCYAADPTCDNMDWVYDAAASGNPVNLFRTRWFTHSTHGVVFYKSTSWCI